MSRIMSLEIKVKTLFNKQSIYRLHYISHIIQVDQKVSVHLMITIQTVTSNVQSVTASLQTFIDTPNSVLEDRVQYSTVHIPNVLYYITV
jgi:hypothetical protein